MKHFKYFLLLFFITSFAYGQKLKPANEVTIDAKTKLPDKLCPFDEYFILNIPFDTSYIETDIKRIDIYRAQKQKANRNSAIVNVNTNSIDSVEVSKWVPFIKRNETMAFGTKLEKKDFEKKEGYNNYKTLVPPLMYAKNYLLTIQYKQPKTWLAKLNEVNQLIFQGRTNQANMLYHSLLLEMLAFNEGANTRLYKDTSPRIDTVSFTLYRKFYTDSLSEKYIQLNDRISNNDTANIKIAYKSLFRQIKECDLCKSITSCDCKEQSVGEQIGGYFDDFILTHCFPADLTQIGFVSGNKKDFYSFIKSSTHGEIGRLDTFNIKNKLGNLDASIKYLESLKQLYRTTTLPALIGDTCKKYLNIKIDSLLNLLKTNQKESNNQMKAITSIMNRMINSGIIESVVVNGQQRNQTNRFDFFQFFDLNSDVADLKTAVGNFIIPDMGIAVMVPLGSEDPTVMLRPYYGINISLKPINKNLRFRDIPNSDIRNYLSFSVGLTYWALNKNHTDIKDLIEETSLVTGLNVRLTRAFRVGMGAISYYQTNPNPVLKMKYSAMPYVSVSADVDVASFLSKLTDRIFK